MLLLQAAQQAVNAVASGAALPVSDPGAAITAESYLHQIYVAAIAVYGIERLKRSTWVPWINANSALVTKAVSWIVALASALAIQVSVTGSATAGWHGTFDIPNAHALWDTLGRIIVSKGMQTGIYDKFFNKPLQVTPVLPPPMDEAGKPVPHPAPQPSIA
jgi:hypothetical protein